VNNNQNKDQDDQSKMKETKKLFESTVQVLTHKFGRSPTLEEITSALVDSPKEEKSNQDAAAQEQEVDMPKILQYKILFGMSDKDDGNGKKSKQPDPHNILFYFDEANHKYYDVDQRDWMATVPSVAQHLPHRDMEDSEDGVDIRDAIINGVMDDEDYEKLCHCDGMMDERMKKLYALTSKLKGLTNDPEDGLAKTEDGEAPDINSEGGMEEDLRSEFQGENLVDTFMDVTGVPPESMFADEEDFYENEDVLHELQENSKGTGVESRIRNWIRQEIEEMKDQIREEVWQAIHSSLDSEMENMDDAFKAQGLGEEEEDSGIPVLNDYEDDEDDDLDDVDEM
jgi:hypothetical protein